MTRIGKKPHTEGIREQYEMIIAPKAKRCPDPEGMVDGTFEWSIEMYRATTGPDGEPQGVLYRRHVVTELKGKVGDDAKVQYVDFDARVMIQHIGMELPYYSHSARIQGQFTIDQRMMEIPQEFMNITVSDFSAGEAEAKDASLMANIALIAAYFQVSPISMPKPNGTSRTPASDHLHTGHQGEETGAERIGCGKDGMRTRRIDCRSGKVQGGERAAKREMSCLSQGGRVAAWDACDVHLPGSGERVKHSGFGAAVSRSSVAQARMGMEAQTRAFDENRTSDSRSTIWLCKERACTI
jgi:hypothetical protein